GTAANQDALVDPLRHVDPARVGQLEPGPAQLGQVVVDAVGELLNGQAPPRGTEVAPPEHAGGPGVARPPPRPRGVLLEERAHGARGLTAAARPLAGVSRRTARRTHEG